MWMAVIQGMRTHCLQFDPYMALTLVVMGFYESTKDRLAKQHSSLEIQQVGVIPTCLQLNAVVQYLCSQKQSLEAASSSNCGVSELMHLGHWSL